MVVYPLGKCLSSPNLRPPSFDLVYTLLIQAFPPDIIAISNSPPMSNHETLKITLIHPLGWDLTVPYSIIRLAKSSREPSPSRCTASMPYLLKGLGILLRIAHISSKL